MEELFPSRSREECLESEPVKQFWALLCMGAVTGGFVIVDDKSKIIKLRLPTE